MKRKRNPTYKCAVCGEFEAYAIKVTKVFVCYHARRLW